MTTDTGNCIHIYKDIKENPCPYCGKETHVIDWKYQNELHKQWIADGKAVFEGWWSI